MWARTRRWRPATTPAAPPPGTGFGARWADGALPPRRQRRPVLDDGRVSAALIGDLTEADAEVFLAKRRGQGFNTIWVNLLCTTYTGCRADGATWDGIALFTTPGDFSTPNQAYFARADRMLRLAERYGFVVVLDPAETGGWLNTMVANGVEKLREYGRYLGPRYKTFPNIVWMHGNDFQLWGPTYDPYVMAVALGMDDVGAAQLQTVELNYFVSGSLDDAAWAPLIDINASYTYEPTYGQVLKDYNRSNFLPTFMVEASYESEQVNPEVPAGTPQQLRRQEYWSLLSGAMGHLYGNHYTWQFICNQRDPAGDCIGDWKNDLDTPRRARDRVRQRPVRAATLGTTSCPIRNTLSSPTASEPSAPTTTSPPPPRPMARSHSPTRRRAARSRSTSPSSAGSSRLGGTTRPTARTRTSPGRHSRTPEPSSSRTRPQTPPPDDWVLVLEVL